MTIYYLALYKPSTEKRDISAFTANVQTYLPGNGRSIRNTRLRRLQEKVEEIRHQQRQAEEISDDLNIPSIAKNKRHHNFSLTPMWFATPFMHV
jgi:hypothetical protein